LPGITRASLLELASDLGYEVEQAAISVERWRMDAGAGRLTEVFSCGTSSMITPVGRVKAADDEWVINDGRPGKVTMRLREELMGIQSGERPDPHGWMHKVI
jgi:branched-chain amino acid aminotransferase